MTRQTAKIFMHGRSQAVRLPKEFRLPGKEVKVSRHGKGVLLEPIEQLSPREWLAEIRQLAKEGEPFLPEGRPPQPPMPDDDETDFDK